MLLPKWLQLPPGSFFVVPGFAKAEAVHATIPAQRDPERKTGIGSL